jgi:hypothetical protein
MATIKKVAAKKPLAKKQAGGASDSTAVFTKTNIFGKKKEITEEKARKLGSKYFFKEKGNIYKDAPGVYTTKPRPNSKRSVTIDSSKTPMKKMGGATKPLAKKQTGGSSKTTPFKDYLKNNKGASASDTVAKTIQSKLDATEADEKGNYYKSPRRLDIKAKNPKNQKALEKAYEKTYGQDIKDRTSSPSYDESHDQYNRRMGYKKGGVVKKTIVKKKK